MQNLLDVQIPMIYILIFIWAYLLGSLVTYKIIKWTIESETLAQESKKRISH